MATVMAEAPGDNQEPVGVVPPVPERKGGEDWAGGLAELEERYEWMHQIGAGVFGVVHQARNKETQELVAVKKLAFDEEYSTSIPAHVLREVSLLQSFVHPNVVRLHEVHMGQHDYYLVFECAELDLHCLLKRLRVAGQQMPMEQVKRYSQQLLNGCHACHVRLVIHRDLKPQNILVSSEGLKICDFGLARLFSPPLRAYTHDVITLWYRSPEILLGAAVYGPEVDMWSAGCCIAEMAIGYPLFPGDSEIGTIFRICRICGTPSEATWQGVSKLEHWKKTLPDWPQTQLEPLRKTRPELEGAGLGLLNGLLTMHPRERLTARRAKQHAFFADLRG